MKGERWKEWKREWRTNGEEGRMGGKLNKRISELQNEEPNRKKRKCRICVWINTDLLQQAWGSISHKQYIDYTISTKLERPYRKKQSRYFIRYLSQGRMQHTRWILYSASWLSLPSKPPPGTKQNQRVASVKAKLSRARVTVTCIPG